jgi:hypothetical protein
LEENFKNKAERDLEDLESIKEGIQKRDALIETMRADNVSLAQA